MFICVFFLKLKNAFFYAQIRRRNNKSPHFRHPHINCVFYKGDVARVDWNLEKEESLQIQLKSTKFVF